MQHEKDISFTLDILLKMRTEIPYLSTLRLNDIKITLIFKSKQLSQKYTQKPYPETIDLIKTIN